MAETEHHRDLLIDTIRTLQLHPATARRFYVSGNLLIYYEEGNPKKCVAPDTFVVFGVHPGRRRIFKIWQEGKGPSFVLETTSAKTRREDQKQKKELYARLNVPEYFLYDPDARRIAVRVSSIVESIRGSVGATNFTSGINRLAASRYSDP